MFETCCDVDFNVQWKIQNNENMNELRLKPTVANEIRDLVGLTVLDDGKKFHSYTISAMAILQ